MREEINQSLKEQLHSRGIVITENEWNDVKIEIQNYINNANYKNYRTTNIGNANYLGVEYKIRVLLDEKEKTFDNQLIGIVVVVQ